LSAVSIRWRTRSNTGASSSRSCARPYGIDRGVSRRERIVTGGRATASDSPSHRNV
jgi:hypothetical protein